MKATFEFLRAKPIVLAMGLLFCVAAQGADAPSSPGFYKYKLGAVTVVALSDGTFALPARDLMIDAHKGEVEAALTKAHAGKTVPTSVNAFLIDTGTRRILVDAGAGTSMGPSLGEVRTHLEAAGYRPDQIDEILITHLHADHVGGLIDSHGMVYPKAVVRVNADEVRFWEDPANTSKVDPSIRVSFDTVAKALKPYEAIGHVKPLHGGETIAPGITAVDETGHTAGHTGYRIDSDGKTLIVWGDVVHLPMAQFPDPKVTIKFDGEPAAAAACREKLLAEATKGGYFIAAAHIAFPGIGSVAGSAQGYEWTPVTQ